MLGRLEVVHAHRVQRDAVVAILLLDAVGDQPDAKRTVLLGLGDDRILQVVAGPLDLSVVGGRLRMSAGTPMDSASW